MGRVIVMPSLYHGTGSLFDKFSSEMLKSGDGSNYFLPAFYLTSSFNLASYYATSNSKKKFCFDKDGCLVDGVVAGDDLCKRYGGVVLDVFVSGSSRVVDGNSLFTIDDARNLLIKYMEKKGVLEEVYELMDKFLSDERFCNDIDSDFFNDFFGKLVFVSNGECLRSGFLSALDDIADEALFYGSGDFDKNSFVEIASVIFDKCVDIGVKKGVFSSYDISDLMNDCIRDEPSWIGAMRTFFSDEIGSDPKLFMREMVDIGIEGFFISEIAVADVSGDCYMFFNPSVLRIDSILEPDCFSGKKSSKELGFDIY